MNWRGQLQTFVISLLCAGLIVVSVRTFHAIDTSVATQQSNTPAQQGPSLILNDLAQQNKNQLAWQVSPVIDTVSRTVGQNFSIPVPVQTIAEAPKPSKNVWIPEPVMPIPQEVPVTVSVQESAAKKILDAEVQEKPALVPKIKKENLSTILVAKKKTGITIPETLHGIYISSWTAGTPSSLQRIFSTIEGTTINAVVIDIKDVTGRLSYMPLDPDLRASGVGTRRIPNITSVIKQFHDKGIYVIGRISVFQDPYLAKIRPQYSYTISGTNTPWQDHKGIGWVRADKTEVWDYVTAIARDASDQGFDEINLDYVRFPSDGALSLIEERPKTEKRRVEIMESFFQAMDQNLRKDSQLMVSADIFGLTVSAKDDLGIGQKLEKIIPYVDYVCPMIYPSHFARGTYGYDKPAEKPYEIIKRSLKEAIKKTDALEIDAQKIRPWLQDFDLGANYDAVKVKAQITAVHDMELPSWMMWNASNVYTKKAYQ